jgi:FG-GAP-like repeat
MKLSKVASLSAAVACLLLTLTAVRAQADPPLFQSPTQYPGFPGLGHGAVVSADFNGDGYPDLAVVDFAAGAVRVLLNRGDGSFAAAELYPTGLGAAGLAAADFDGDGHVDLAVANMVDSTVVVLTNRGDGTLARRATYPTSPLPGRIVTADFNGDGRPDLAIATSGPTGNLVVLLNQGGGHFARAQTLTVGIGLNLVGGVASMETADVNGDHRPDLLVADQLRGVTVLIGRGDGTFSTGATLPIRLYESFAVGDVNHDGIVDVAIPDSLRNSVSVFLGRGDGTFAPPIVSTVNPHRGVVPTLPVAAALADLNGDGNLDLAVSGGTDRTLHIMLGEGTGRFITTEGYPVQIGRTIIADDFNHDGRPDLAVTELLGQTEVLLHN